MAGPNNQNATKHGGAAAERAVSTGGEFRGPAVTAQAEVHADYEIKGAAHMVQQGAERLEAAARLYWAAIIGAAQNGAATAVLDGYIARFGWLQSKAITAWAEVRRADGKQSVKTIDAILGKDNQHDRLQP